MARLAGMIALLALALSAPEGRAESAPERAAALCERAAVAGARRGGAPEAVLHAIALTETGRPLGGRLRPWPWAINREGEGHWFATREEALAFARASVAEGRRSFDVGCFQINYHWHGREFASLEAMFDQEAGGAYAARFLRELEDELGSWTAAAGAYHSRTPELARRVPRAVRAHPRGAGGRGAGVGGGGAATRGARGWGRSPRSSRWARRRGPRSGSSAAGFRRRPCRRAAGRRFEAAGG
jgi:hypothetical protein